MLVLKIVGLLLIVAVIVIGGVLLSCVSKLELEIKQEKKNSLSGEQ